jgi:hypothetical protein
MSPKRVREANADNPCATCGHDRDLHTDLNGDAVECDCGCEVFEPEEPSEDDEEDES